MLRKSRITFVASLAAVVLGAAPALALSAEPESAAGEFAASLSDHPGETRAVDLRGEAATSSADRPTAPPSAAVDLRGEAARGPFAQPVVVEVGDPVSGGFDWTAAIIGLGAGLALAVLVGVGVTGGRRRHGGPTTA
jgi:hypothetical protein